MELGRLAVNEPRRLPGRLAEILRRTFHKVWSTRGGGLYATGVFVAFLWLETASLAGEIAGASNAGDFVTQQVLGFVFRFSVTSLVNTAYALAWPALLVSRYGVAWGLGVLAALYAVFRLFVKGPIERWLAGAPAGGEPPPVEPEQDP